MAQADFIKPSHAINDELKLTANSFISLDNAGKSFSSLDKPSSHDDDLDIKTQAHPGLWGQHLDISTQQAMEFNSYTPPEERGRQWAVELSSDMTFHSHQQQPQPHLQRHSKWTNRKYLPGVVEQDNFQHPPSHNDIAVVLVDKDSPKSQLPLQQQIPKNSVPLPSAEAWSDNNSDQTENKPVQSVTTAKSKVDQTPQQKSNTSSSQRHPKSKTVAPGVSPRPHTSTAQPPSQQHHPNHIVFPSVPHLSNTYRHRFPTSPSSTPFLTEEMIRQKELDLFYKNYDPREGVVTAIVLGGFFVFVSLLVLYKTKCKPMWKNRKKRLTNTPVTHSVVEGDSIGRCIFDFPSGMDDVPVLVEEPEEKVDGPVCEDEDFGFECIPLQTVCNDDDDDNDDIYFLDEFGNYVFPVSTPTIPGSCSCPPSAEDLSTNSRRVSQVSNMSAAYTVKSLPGGYIYIPVSESNIQNVSSSMPSVKRTLSDPEIHFTNPLGAHPIILTVNPSSEFAGNFKHQNHRHHQRLSQRSYSVQQEGTTPNTTTSSRGHSISEVTATSIDDTPTTTAIDINVIQATPNISPSCSLRSFSVDSSTPSAEAILTAIANEPCLHQPQFSPAISSSGKGKVQRRVSFSEEEFAVTEKSSAHGSAEWPKPSTSNNRKGPIRQNTLPSAMSYLTVPGQQAVTMMAPALTVEALTAQTSVQARKRRSTRLMKAGSFSSIMSEGDGDIFGPGGQLFHTVENEVVEVTINEEGEEEIVVTSRSRKPIDPLLSDYSEFYDNDKSDISDLFERRPPSRLRGQRTLSDEYGSVRSLSDDQEEDIVPSPLQCLSNTNSLRHNLNKNRSVEDDEDTYASSSCSISIESDCEPSRGHQITVPVTIEPPPPEMRTGANVRTDHLHPSKNDLHEDIEVCQGQQQTSPKTGSMTRYAQDSTEEIKRASPGGKLKSPEVKHKAVSIIVEVEEEKQPPPKQEPLPVTPQDPGMRMVLVRDIGVQVSGDSPNLNLNRRMHKRHQPTQHHQLSQTGPQRQDSLAEKFPAEILF